MIYIGCDHRGFELKEKLKKYLIEQGYDVEDVGAHEYDPEDDFPDFAYAAALKVADNPETNRGILICGSGMGMDATANKVKGVLATLVQSREDAEHARASDNMNVMTLAGDRLTFEEAYGIVDTFLKTDFSFEARHFRRFKKIKEIEERHFK